MEHYARPLHSLPPLLAAAFGFLLVLFPTTHSFSTFAPPPKPIATHFTTPPPPPVVTMSADNSIVLTWEPNAAAEIRRLAEENAHLSRPLLVAIVGIPGSGKTTGANLIQELLGPDAVVIPMDGYHYTRAQLRARPDAAAALYRRGAPDTIDGAALAADVGRLRHGDATPTYFPGFDHAVADPQPDQYCVTYPQHKICIVEGLYLLHDADGWESLSDMWDYTIFVDANVDVCMDRVRVRNQKIPGYTAEEIAVRVEEVDRVNAMTVVASKKRADRVVDSPSWAPLSQV